MTAKPAAWRFFLPLEAFVEGGDRFPGPIRNRLSGKRPRAGR